MADFGTFFFSVVDQWLELLSGCIVLVLIGLFEKLILKREVPIRVYMLVLAAFVFWACFEAWKEQYEINKNAPSIQMSLTELQSESRDLKEFKAGATAELNTLRHEKEVLRRDLDGKVTENQLLRDEIKLARVSTLNPIIDIADPYLRYGPDETLLVIPLMNLGQAQATVTSTETTILISGQQFSHDIDLTPFALRPHTRPFEFNRKLSNAATNDVKNSRASLEVILEFTYTGILGDKNVGCIYYHFGKESERPHGKPKECKKKADKS